MGEFVAGAFEIGERLGLVSTEISPISTAMVPYAASEGSTLAASSGILGQTGAVVGLVGAGTEIGNNFGALAISQGKDMVVSKANQVANAAFAHVSNAVQNRMDNTVKLAKNDLTTTFKDLRMASKGTDRTPSDELALRKPPKKTPQKIMDARAQRARTGRRGGYVRRWKTSWGKGRNFYNSPYKRRRMY